MYIWTKRSSVDFLVVNYHKFNKDFDGPHHYFFFLITIKWFVLKTHLMLQNVEKKSFYVQQFFFKCNDFLSAISLSYVKRTGLWLRPQTSLIFKHFKWTIRVYLMIILRTVNNFRHLHFTIVETALLQNCLQCVYSGLCVKMNPHLPALPVL